MLCSSHRRARPRWRRSDPGGRAAPSAGSSARPREAGVGRSQAGPGLRGAPARAARVSCAQRTGTHPFGVGATADVHLSPARKKAIYFSNLQETRAARGLDPAISRCPGKQPGPAACYGLRAPKKGRWESAHVVDVGPDHGPATRQPDGPQPGVGRGHGGRGEATAGPDLLRRIIVPACVALWAIYKTVTETTVEEGET